MGQESCVMVKQSSLRMQEVACLSYKKPAMACLVSLSESFCKQLASIYIFRSISRYGKDQNHGSCRLPYPCASPTAIGKALQRICWV